MPDDGVDPWTLLHSMAAIPEASRIGLSTRRVV
jgi:hypothetical protein